MRRSLRLRRTLPAVLMVGLLVVCSLLLGAAGKSSAHGSARKSGINLAASVSQHKTDVISASTQEARILPLRQIVMMSDVPQETAQPISEATGEMPAESQTEAENENVAEKTMTTLPTPLPESSTATARVVAVPKAGQNVPENLELIDTFLATAYCVSGTTATGAQTTIDRTLAVNPYVIPFGSHVWLFLDDGTLVGDFYAEDTGTNMMQNPYVVDIYMGEGTYDECIEWGVQHVTVYIEPEAEPTVSRTASPAVAEK